MTAHALPPPPPWESRTCHPPGTGMFGPSSVSNSHGKAADTSSAQKKPSNVRCCFSRNSQLSAKTASSSGVRPCAVIACGKVKVRHGTWVGVNTATEKEAISLKKVQ